MNNETLQRAGRRRLEFGSVCPNAKSGLVLKWSAYYWANQKWLADVQNEPSYDHRALPRDQPLRQQLATETPAFLNISTR